MTYKGIEWEDCGTSENPEKRAHFHGFWLYVFPDDPLDIAFGWSYRVEVSRCYKALLSGYHLATEELAMREAIFDAMVLKAKDLI